MYHKRNPLDQDDLLKINMEPQSELNKFYKEKWKKENLKVLLLQSDLLQDNWHYLLISII